MLKKTLLAIWMVLAGAVGMAAQSGGGQGIAVQFQVVTSVPSTCATAGTVFEYNNAGSYVFYTCPTASVAPVVISSSAGGNVSTAGLTANYIPMASGTATVANSHCDDGATFAGMVTCSEPIYVPTFNGTTSFVLNSIGAYFGVIQNDGPNLWGLGYTSRPPTTHGVPVIEWNESGNAAIGTIASPSGNFAAGSLQTPTTSTVSALPSCASGTLGEHREVSDANSATPGTTAAGSGTYTIGVECIYNSSGATYTWIIN